MNYFFAINDSECADCFWIVREHKISSKQEDDMPSKFTSRTTWREKLERVQEPKVVDIPPKMQVRFGTGKMRGRVEVITGAAGRLGAKHAEELDKAVDAKIIIDIAQDRTQKLLERF